MVVFLLETIDKSVHIRRDIVLSEHTVRFLGKCASRKQSYEEFVDTIKMYSALLSWHIRVEEKLNLEHRINNRKL